MRQAAAAPTSAASSVAVEVAAAAAAAAANACSPLFKGRLIATKLATQKAAARGDTPGARSAGSSSLLAMRAVTTEPSAQPTSPDSSAQPAGSAGTDHQGTHCMLRALCRARTLAYFRRPLPQCACWSAPSSRGVPSMHEGARRPARRLLLLRRLRAKRSTSSQAAGSSAMGCGPSAMLEM